MSGDQRVGTTRIVEILIVISLLRCWIRPLNDYCLLIVRLGELDLDRRSHPRSGVPARGSIRHEAPLPVGGLLQAVSIAFIVVASSSISSPVPGDGTRRSSSSSPIESTSRRIRDTGSSVRPTSHHTISPSTATATGIVMSSADRACASPR